MPETNIQQEFLKQADNYFALKFPYLMVNGKCPFYSVPNEGKRPKRNASRMIAEGLRSGIPDLHLPIPRGDYSGLFLEFKSAKGKPTANQEIWGYFLIKWHRVLIVRSVKAAMGALIEYMEGDTK